MRHDRKVQLWAGVVLAASLVLSGALSVQLTAIAGRERLSYTDRAEDGDRWEVAAGVAMGAFRGIFVNALWMRANDMKEAGKFFDAVDLARAITRLQPRFPRVWVFHAWNLAYNISVQTQTREERWNWVNQGIAILRDEGLRANPNDVLLHRELAWIFLHKIQGYTDDANPYYKRRLAMEWTAVLGQPPAPGPEDRDRNKAIEKYAGWLSQFANATVGEAELLEKHPRAGEILARMRSELELGIETREQRRMFLERVEMTRQYLGSSRRFIMDRMGGPKTKALVGMLDDPANKEAWDALLAHVRRRVLVEDYNMEPDRMIRYTRKYGPIDWRHAAAHALYWSARGVEETLDLVTERNRRDFDFVNADRLVVQSLQELFRSGELYFDFRAAVVGQYTLWQGVPNPHFVQSYGDVLNEMRMRPDNIYDRQGEGGRGFSPLSAGYENFLIDATLFFYRRGEREVAEGWLRLLREFPEQNLTDPESRIQRFLSLDEFAQVETADRFTNPSMALNQVSASLMAAYSSGLLARNPDLFRAQFNWAASAHRYFFEKQARQTVVNRDNVRMALMDEDFAFVAGTLFAQFVAGLGVEDAESVYNAAPDGLKLYAYDAIVETLKPQVDAEARELGGRGFDVIFPAPRGLQQFRTEMARRLEQRSRGTAPVERK